MLRIKQEREMFSDSIKHYKTISKYPLEMIHRILLNMIKYKLVLRQLLNIQTQVITYYRIGL